MWYLYFTGVVIFGWPNIQPVLEDRGVFRNHCDPSDVERSNDNTCDAQKKELGLVFNVSSAVSFLFNFLNGLLLDKFGVKVTVFVSLTYMSLGAALVALASSEVVGVDYDRPSEEIASTSSTSETLTIFFGFSLMGAGSVGTLHPMFNIANLFSKIRYRTLTALNGFADASAVMFAIFRVLFFSASISLHAIFSGYLLGPVLICYMFTFVLWPRWPFKSEEELQAEEERDTLTESPSTRHDDASSSSSVEVLVEDDLKEESVNVEKPGPEQTTSRGEEKTTVNSDKPQHASRTDPECGGASDERAVKPLDLYPHLGKPFTQQWKTFRYIGATLFTWINILKFNYFLVSLNSVMDSLGDSDGVYTEAFGWLSIGGVVVVFFTGTIIDRYGLVGGLWGSNISGLLLSVLSLVPVLELQIVTFAVFVIFRSFLFSIAASFMSTEFGVKNFGKLLGLTFMTAGGFGFVAQPLLTLGLAENFTLPGVIVLILTACQSVFPFLYTRAHNMRTKSHSQGKGYRE